MDFQREKWSKTDYLELISFLASLGEEKLQAFHKTLVPNAGKIYGIRLPKLRSIAKEIAKGDWRGYLKIAQDVSHEEIMLQGMVIGCIKAGFAEILPWIENFIPKINNWAVCDSFCSGLKIFKKNPGPAVNFLEKYFQSDREFDLRFAIVMRMELINQEEDADLFLQALYAITHEGYYVKMAAAWALSVCFVKFPPLTLAFLQKQEWDDFTYKKALQKIIESYRVEDSAKALIRQMRQKKEAVI